MSDERKVLGDDGETSRGFISDTHNSKTKFNIQGKTGSKNETFLTNL